MANISKTLTKELSKAFTETEMILDFLGVEKVGSKYDLYSHPQFNFLFDSVDSADDKAKHHLSVISMKFKTSWDWLMTVIEKINKIATIARIDQCVYINKGDDWFSLNPEINGERVLCYEQMSISEGGRDPLTNHYNAAVEFIKWHNESHEKLQRTNKA